MEPARLVHPARRRASAQPASRKRKRSEDPESVPDQPPRKRAKPAAPRKSTRRGRRDQHSSLRALARRFVQLISRSKRGQADLNDTCSSLNVPKRRIYDITNVLEGIGLIEKKSKNTILWKGDEVQFGDLQKLIEQGGRQGPPANLPERRNVSQDVSSPSEIAKVKAVLETLLDEVSRLRDESKQVDADLEGTRERLRALTEHHLNYDKAYVTYKDVTSLPGMEDRTIIAIRADPFTTLTVPDPDDTDDEFLFAPTSRPGLIRSPKRKKPKRRLLTPDLPAPGHGLPTPPVPGRPSRTYVNPYRGIGLDEKRYQIFLNSPEGELGTGSVNVYLLSEDIDPSLPPVPTIIPEDQRAFPAARKGMLMAAKAVVAADVGVSGVGVGVGLKFPGEVADVSRLFAHHPPSPERMPNSPLNIPVFGDPRTPPRNPTPVREGSLPLTSDTTSDDSSGMVGFLPEVSIPTPMSPGQLMELPQPKTEPDFVFTLDQAEGVAELFPKEGMGRASPRRVRRLVPPAPPQVVSQVLMPPASERDRTPPRRPRRRRF